VGDCLVRTVTLTVLGTLVVFACTAGAFRAERPIGFSVAPYRTPPIGTRPSDRLRRHDLPTGPSKRRAAEVRRFSDRVARAESDSGRGQTLEPVNRPWAR
jgi:hypothetical protein